MTTIPKLSEAIRLGEFALPPVHGDWFERDKNTGAPCGACAVGRTCYAAGFRYDEYGDSEMRQLSVFMVQTWPWVKNCEVRLDQPDVMARQYWTDYTFKGINEVLIAISNLYECYDWSMSRIADYVATIEPAAVPATVATVDEEVEA